MQREAAAYKRSLQEERGKARPAAPGEAVDLPPGRGKPTGLSERLSEFKEGVNDDYFAEFKSDDDKSDSDRWGG